MSTRTIALTLRPTAAEKTALLRLQERFNAACNDISGVAWEAQEFNKVRLQRLCYGDIRREYGLMAQHTIRAIAVVADAYTRDHATTRTFRADAAVVLDTPRLYRVKHNRARITTLDGRVSIELGIGGHQRRQLADAVKLAEADLIRDRKGRWRLLVSAHYADPPTHDTEDVIGVDLGQTDGSCPHLMKRKKTRLATIGCNIEFGLALGANRRHQSCANRKSANNNGDGRRSIFGERTCDPYRRQSGVIDA